MRIEIKNRWTNKVIHVYEAENAKIKEAVLDALEKGANLSDANLRDANLYSANLSGANLSDANLRDANLYGANLSDANLSDANLSDANLYGANLSDANLYGANLSDANLRDANLSGANLSDANLSDANLRDANLSGANLSDAIKIPIYCRWSHGITNENLIHIGCETRTIEKWDVFFASDEKLSTERNTPEFKQIEAVYLAYKAYLTHLQS